MKINFLFLILFSASAFAATEPKPQAPDIDPQLGCTLKTTEIEDRANQIFRDNQNFFPVTTFVKDLDIQTSPVLGSVEIFYRPQEDLTIELSQKSKMLLKLDHDADLVYICVNLDQEHLDKTHMSIYFLRGSGLSGDHARDLIDAINYHLPSLPIRSAPAKLGFDGTMDLSATAEKIIDQVPGINIAYGLFKGLILKPVEIFGQSALNVLKLSVVAVIVTPSGVQLKSGIDGGKSVFQTFTNINKSIDQSSENPQAPKAERSEE